MLLHTTGRGHGSLGPFSREGLGHIRVYYNKARLLGRLVVYNITRWVHPSPGQGLAHRPRASPHTRKKCDLVAIAAAGPNRRCWRLAGNSAIPIQLHRVVAINGCCCSAGGALLSACALDRRAWVFAACENLVKRRLAYPATPRGREKRKREQFPAFVVLFWEPPTRCP